MHLDDAANDLLKTWIITKLENISDADSDVLADYVLALVKTDEPETAARANCVDNLKDFLLDATELFVDELFQAITTRSFDPHHAPLKPTAPVFKPLNGLNAEPTRLHNESRKRPYQDGDLNEAVTGHGRAHRYDGTDRPFKQAKRGGRGRDQRAGRQMQPHIVPSDLPPPPLLPGGVPPFDPNDPMAAMIMQHAMSFFSSMQNGQAPTNDSTPGAQLQKQRCWNYDNLGACSLGVNCPFEHGEDRLLVPHNQEYDPRYATLLDVEPTRVGRMDVTQSERSRGRGRGRGRGVGNWRGGGKRSAHSRLGPPHDMRDTQLVVEQIPDNKRDEQTVREYFEQFGDLTEVEMHTQDQLAILRFADHDAAQAAYDAPDAIFGNRFVKLYWYKHEKHEGLRNGAATANGGEPHVQETVMDEDDQIDMEQIARRQEEAQQKHEEAERQRDEATKKRQDVSSKLAEMEVERRKMEEMLARKAGKPTAGMENGGEHAKATALKAHLAQLEAEAKSLGIDPDAASLNGFGGYSSYRGSGSYRGRGRGRGRGSFRGYGSGWTRGGVKGGGRGGGGAVMRLDNRPKTVAVHFTEGSFDRHDEAVRQYLLFSSLDSATLSKHPEHDDVALIAFDQRYEGEMFMAAVARSEVPHVGKVELSWYKPDETKVHTDGDHESNGDKMIIQRSSEPPSPEITGADAYDVAHEDLDRYS